MTDGGRVLFVGRLVDSKRPMDVVQAAARLVADGRPVDLVIAGAGELQGRMEEAARAGGVDARFLGFVNQSKLPAVYASSDVVVLPSIAIETWGSWSTRRWPAASLLWCPTPWAAGLDMIQPGFTGRCRRSATFRHWPRPSISVLALDPATVRRALAERMEIYSPARAADGVLEAADALLSPGVG